MGKPRGSHSLTLTPGTECGDRHKKKTKLRKLDRVGKPDGSVDKKFVHVGKPRESPLHKQGSVTFAPGTVSGPSTQHQEPVMNEKTVNPCPVCEELDFETSQGKLKPPSSYVQCQTIHRKKRKKSRVCQDEIQSERILPYLILIH